MKPRVIVTQLIHQEIEELLSAQAEVVINKAIDPWPRADLLEVAHNADALMVFMPDSIDDEFLSTCPRLRIIAAALKGFDNFNVEACTRRGIWFSIVPDLLTEPTAELALALTLSLARHVLPGDRLLRSGAFQGWRPVLYGTGLAGSTIGLIGYGKVAQALARMLQGFQSRLLYHDLAVSGSASLEDLLAASDFVLPLLPLTPATLHLLNRDTIGRMKPGAFLINVSRGSIVKEEAVADALEAGHLSGYAADTFEMEDWARHDRPRSVSPRLLALPGKTLFTPHLGSAVAKVRLEIERAAARNILQALKGERPSGAVNSLLKDQSLQ